MARIDFAIGAPDRIRQACLTTFRQYASGRRLVVYCSQPQRLRAFDEQLWSVDDTAFVPHVMSDSPLAAATPVILVSQGLDVTLAGQSGPIWLLNLDDDCPPGVERVERVLEIVSTDEQDRVAARLRWKAYQSAGHDVRSHALDTK